jgi:hypothetical protein
MLEKYVSGQPSADLAILRAAKAFVVPSGDWVLNAFLTEEDPRLELAEEHGATQRQVDSPGDRTDTKRPDRRREQPLRRYDEFSCQTTVGGLPGRPGLAGGSNRLPRSSCRTSQLCLSVQQPFSCPCNCFLFQDPEVPTNALLALCPRV